MIAYRHRSLLGGLFFLLLAAGAAAQETPASQDVKETVDQTIETRQSTQQQKDQWSREKAALVQRYRAARAGVDWLTERKAAEMRRVQALESAVAELQRRLDETDRLESSIQDTLTVLLGRLEDQVDRGLPFLATEREQRLQLVAEELARPDVTSAEKLRRLLEAMQIEAGFASNIEVYQAEITVDGQPMFADILRVGRLALFWRTPDGSRVGHFDQAAGRWSELPGSEKRNIGLAMEMATRMRPFAVIELPLGRIAPQAVTP